jgi:hypothetical protein
MIPTAKTVLLLGLLLISWTDFLPSRSEPKTEPSPKPEYTADAQLKFPEHYREWVYLNNVFVNPEAYKAFVATGTWPDKTILVIEGRRAVGKGSINQKGNFQGDTMAFEAHVKDEARFPGKWAFFGFGDQKTAKMIPTTADCYSCHASHAAVDTTFVQFYPTLLPIAKSKGTLSPAYQKEAEAPAQK